MFIIQEKIINKHSVYLFICLFFLITSIIIPPLKLASYTLYLTTFSCFFVFLFSFVYGVRVNKFFFKILLIGFTVIFSSLYSFSLGLTSHNMSNYIESMKYFQFIPYLMLLSLIDRVEGNVFNKIMSIVISLFIIVFFIQFFNFLNLKEFFLKIYLSNDSGHFEKALNGWRLTLTGSDPNIGAAIAVFLIIYCLDRFLSGANKLYLLLVAILFVAILSTQSRTGLVASVVSMFIILILSNVNFLNKILICFIFIILFSGSLYFVDIDYIVAGYELSLVGENESANIRIDNLNQGLSLFYNSPYLGYGPAKNEVSTIIDSEYVLILQRYGLLGIFLFSYFIMNLIYYGFKARKYTSGRILFAYTIFTLFFMITNNAYSGYQLMSITIFAILWVYSDLRRNAVFR